MDCEINLWWGNLVFRFSEFVTTKLYKVHFGYSYNRYNNDDSEQVWYEYVCPSHWQCSTETNTLCFGIRNITTCTLYMDNQPFIKIVIHELYSYRTSQWIFDQSSTSGITSIIIKWTCYWGHTRYSVGMWVVVMRSYSTIIDLNKNLSWRSTWSEFDWVYDTWNFYVEFQIFKR